MDLFMNADWKPQLVTETWESQAILKDLTRIEGPTILIIGRRFYHYDDERLLKVGGDEDEAWMTALARRVLQDSSKVPRVYSFIQMPNNSAILMDRISGVPLSTVWDDISEEQRLNVTDQLYDILLAVRRPVFEYAGRPDHKPYILPNTELGSDAHDFCANIEAWNASRARAIMANTVDSPQAAAFRDQQYQLVTGTAADRFVLTHGDLSDRNIIVDPDSLNITGIIDWEDANVVPCYFEYIAARLSEGHLPQWRKVLLGVLEKVLERECEEKGASYLEELVRWKALVDVERYAHGLDEHCTWTFDSETTKI
ncbi:hypothetical protein FQN49_000599 [Arthroderma sp. PD_2]|nr:hypothetical protein FQN49_000599 [Arthroderma sp. PD_2]